MPTVSFKAPVTVFDHNSELETGRATEVTDPTILKRYHGYQYHECFADYMSGINDRTLEDAGVSGGYLCFEYNSAGNTLFAITEYQLARLLEDIELTKLREYTLGQWSDGIGSNVYQEGMDHDGIALSVECWVDRLIETVERA